ncbi:flippase [Candidatus Curtissbacteria bacterium]|nr:flippase [Candidatus Curtissbacteria bacterium]
MFKKVIYNTSAQVFGKLITASVTLLVTIIIGRSLGEAGFGDFTKVFTLVGYFYTFADFGLNAIYVKKNDEKSLLFPILLGLRVLIAICLIVLAVTLSLVLPYNQQTGIGFPPLVKWAIAIASLTILTQAIYTTTNAIFQKKLRYDLSTLAAIGGALTILVGAALGAYYKSGLLIFSAIYAIGGIVTLLIALYILAQKFKIEAKIRFDLAKSKALLKGAAPIGVALILNLIYFRIDVLILSVTKTSAEVGIYGLAYQFFEASLAVPIFFANALYPLLISLKQKNKEAYHTSFNKWIGLLGAVALLHTAALFMVAILIPIVYNGRFMGSVAALQILATGVIFFYLSALFWHGLIILGKQKHLVIIYGSGAIFNLLSNLILIPTYGYLAAALVTVVSEAFILVLLALDYAHQKKHD